MCDLLCFCWLHSWHPTSSWLPDEAQHPLIQQAIATICRLHGCHVCGQQLKEGLLAPAAGDGNCLVIINQIYSNLLINMFFFIWLLYYSYRWSTDWSSIDLLLILSGLLCFAGDWWFLDMLDGGCMGMSLSAGNFRWVVLWMCLETLPTQEVSPEGGSSCLKLGSGIS